MLRTYSFTTCAVVTHILLYNQIFAVEHVPKLYWFPGNPGGES